MRQDGSGFTTLIVADRDAGQRLDAFLARRFDLSRAALRTRMAQPPVGDDQRPLKWSQRMRAGQRVFVARIVRPEPEVAVHYRILYQDEWLVAVDKGPGAPVHPARSFRTRTILTRLRAELGEPGLSPAHRLDRETSGVLVFGRRPDALTALGRQFAAGQVSKQYLAVASGSPAFESITIDRPLARDPDFPIRCKMRIAPEGGLAAVTEVTVVERVADRCLLAVRPRSGRMHQIRVHLASLGMPILGDKLYRLDGRMYLAQIHQELPADWIEQLGHSRLALHAERLTFRHPGTGQSMCLEAPLPEDLRAVLRPVAP